MRMDVLPGSSSSDGLEIMRETLSRILHECTQGVEYLFRDSIATIEQSTDHVPVTFEHARPTRSTSTTTLISTAPDFDRGISEQR